MDNKWLECRELVRKFRYFFSSRVKLKPSFLYCFGGPYNFLVIMKDWMTAIMDPCLLVINWLVLIL